MDTAQHYLDDNFSDVMRSSALGSNVSSLFNTTTFTTTHSEQKVTLDWILPDGKNSQLENTEGQTHYGFPSARRKHWSNASVPAGPGTIL